MITNYSITKTGGQIGLKSCEGGIPIMGRTDLNGGVYLPIKVDNSGKLLTGSGAFVTGQSSQLLTTLATPNTFTQAEIIANDLLFNPFSITPINYEFTPYFIIPSNTQNGIFDLIIYLEGSAISNYINTLTMGVSSFDPAQTDLDGILTIENICHGNVNGFNINATSTGISGSVFVSTNLNPVKVSLSNQNVRYALVANRNHNPDIWGGIFAEIKYNVKNVFLL